MKNAGVCSVCGKVLLPPYIVCALCGRPVCNEHQQGGVCDNCRIGRRIR